MKCEKCGHPNVNPGGPMRSPDPRNSLTADCSLCKTSIVYDTHHWEAVTLAGKKYVCCACYSVTAPLTNHPLAISRKDV